MTRSVALELTEPLPCRGQLVDLPHGRYDWLRIDLSAPAQPESAETAWLYYEHGVDPERFVVSAAEPDRVWLPVPRRDVLLAVRLPDRPELVLSAMAMVVPQRAAEEVGAGT
ncbi:hypothetical protein OG883_12765 [Streptomyces sp. NBC_01142]|uniref:hypothetical protein n=1 Tax=Streptomyces sp. NBC_01142 TaxID=2975865 RepID=UPI00225B907E|nr:hypothetical protein [Streptomyces sp. NBC_01142]MCX4820765.1 hypothetical protein [Streptomyces sp. NBC_01142]